MAVGLIARLIGSGVAACGAILALSQPAAAEIAHRLYYRTLADTIIEVLTPAAEGFDRRTIAGVWLGRVSESSRRFRFTDLSGHTIATAIEEFQPPGSKRRALAVVRDPTGKLLGIITAQ